MKFRCPASLLSTVIVAAGAGLAAAQQPVAPAQQSATPVQQRPPEPPGSGSAELRARLERRLADSQALQERLERALKRLDEGASTDEVRGMIEPERRGGPGGPGGPDRPPRGEGRGRGGPGGDDVGFRPPPKMEPDAVLAFLDQHNPDWAKRLREASKQNPQMVERLLDRLEPHIREAQAERDPETRELRIAELRIGYEVMGATRRFTETLRRNAPAPEVEQARADLSRVLGEHFDVRAMLREREIVALEQRLTELRAEVRDRQARKESFVAERLTQLARFVEERHERQQGEGAPQRKP